MAPRQSRRALLRATALATTGLVAGCSSDDGTEPGGGTTTEGPTTYGIRVNNALTPEQFEGTSELSGPEPATVTVRVSSLAPGSEPFFERTTTVETGGETTFEEAFTVEPDGPTYAMSAEIEPFVDGGLSRDHNRKGDLTFTPDERPEANPIRIVIRSLDPDDYDGLYPTVSIHERPADG